MTKTEPTIAGERTQFSPAPWKAIGREIWSGDMIVARACNDVSDVDDPTKAHSHDKLLNDARLIAAAPDLLAACKEWERLHNIVGLDRGMRRAMKSHAHVLSRDAIRRTEGK